MCIFNAAVKGKQDEELNMSKVSNLNNCSSLISIYELTVYIT